ncbi:MAG: AAA family ATPase [Cytophagales bacterium]|nr:AAA family ATPase [Cytophagales bacterium]
MLLLSEYTLLERISLGGSTLLYRAERCHDKQKVMLKILEPAGAGADEKARLTREYEFAGRFPVKGIPRYLHLETYHNRQIAILEHVEGVPLEKYLRETRPDPEVSLRIALSVTEILESFHQQGIVHGGLCPAHLLVDPHTFDVQFVDFSIAGRGAAPAGRPRFLPGTLAYISPEQTGRTGGEIDNRSDLYSLGVLLYELLTGTRPFDAKDALEVIHCHLAKNPVPPHVVDVRVPPVLSEVVGKLMAKNAADRYQSPFGLRPDLETCLAQWRESGAIAAFEPGRHDFPGRLQAPGRLYGREAETDVLRRALERVRAGDVHTVLIEGSSGVGKSALAHQARRAKAGGGIFLEGKFNQFQRNVPYFAFSQAFQAFTDGVLTRGAAEVAAWRTRILEAVGPNGGVLTDLMPHLELLTGPQPRVPALEPGETQNRFHYVLLNFIKGIGRAGHPLVLFFDDLQWADAASLHLLKVILTDKDLAAFLCIGAYRGNEMTANSPFSAVVEDLQAEGQAPEKIVLAPLPGPEAAALVHEMLACPVREGEALTELVYEKSQGNPFFIHAFLKCLHAEGVLRFDFPAACWTWDAGKVGQLRFTENIVELMAGRIQKLPAATQEALRLAACLGFGFNAHVLTVVLETTRTEVTERLKPALAEDLILPDGDNYRFTHDRIQQAAYSLIAEAGKKREHLRIGNALLRSLDDEARNGHLFEIVNQLNVGIGSIDGQAEKDRLAALNLTAGLRARDSAAYKPSFEYLQTGIGLIGPDGWGRDYALALQLYTAGAESAYLCNYTGQMEGWVEVVLSRAASDLDKVRAYEIRIKSYTARHQLLDAVRTSLEVLGLLGVRFPKRPNKVHVLSALLGIRLALRGRSPEDLVDLPAAKNPYAEAAIRVLASVGAAVYVASPALFPLFVCRAFSLTVRHGNTAYSGVVCASYGLVLIGGVHNVEGGYRLGKVAVRLSDKFGVSHLRTQCTMIVNTFILHWKEPLVNILEPLRRNYWYGLETGNIEFAAYSAQVYCYSAFYCGHNLQAVTGEMERFLDRIGRLRQDSSHHLLSIHTQAALNLCELVENPTVLTGRVHNEPEMMRLYAATKASVAIFDVYLYKTMLAYLFGDYREARRNGKRAGQLVHRAMSNSYLILYQFYNTLTTLALAATAFGPHRKGLLREAAAGLARLRRFARHNPTLVLHKQELAEAEYCRVTGRHEKAAVRYDQAADRARENGFLNDAALACERAAGYYGGRGRTFIAGQYLQRAYGLYGQWGAYAKVRDLENKHPQLLRQLPDDPFGGLSLAVPADEAPAADFPAGRNSAVLDLHSIMKAAAALSGEIQFDGLLKKLIVIAVENAGAGQGYLILRKENEFFIEAAGAVDGEAVVSIESLPVKGSPHVSEGIVQFVYVTQENLVIDNAAAHPNFAADPVITAKGSKSLLCTPIIHQGEVIGLLYFENNLIANAFTHDRIELLQLLSGQMAVSIRNALDEQKKTNDFRERETLLRKINQQQGVVARAILQTQENERRRIAEELHDGLGYMLSTLKLNLTSLDEGGPGRSEVQGRFLGNSLRLLEDAFRELKAISNNLMPDLLFQSGLLVAVEDLCRKVNDTGKLTVAFRHFNVPRKLRKDFEIEVFRIVQEILNNTIKHAGVGQLEIQFLAEPDADTLVITTEDDGRGFDYEKKIKSKNKGQGLVNITNRVNFLRGHLHVESREGVGTTYIINLPLAAKPVNAPEYDKTIDCR